MNELAYLLLVLVVSGAGSAVFWFRQRQPKSMESGVQQFSRGLSALSTVTVPADRRGSGSATRR